MKDFVKRPTHSTFNQNYAGNNRPRNNGYNEYRSNYSNNRNMSTSERPPRYPHGPHRPDKFRRHNSNPSFPPRPSNNPAKTRSVFSRLSESNPNDRSHAQHRRQNNPELRQALDNNHSSRGQYSKYSSNVSEKKTEKSREQPHQPRTNDQKAATNISKGSGLSQGPNPEPLTSTSSPHPFPSRNKLEEIQESKTTTSELQTDSHVLLQKKPSEPLEKPRSTTDGNLLSKTSTPSHDPLQAQEWKQAEKPRPGDEVDCSKPPNASSNPLQTEETDSLDSNQLVSEENITCRSQPSAELQLSSPEVNGQTSSSPHSKPAEIECVVALHPNDDDLAFLDDLAEEENTTRSVDTSGSKKPDNISHSNLTPGKVSSVQPSCSSPALSPSKTGRNIQSKHVKLPVSDSVNKYISKTTSSEAVDSLKPDLIQSSIGKAPQSTSELGEVKESTQVMNRGEVYCNNSNSQERVKVRGASAVSNEKKVDVFVQDRLGKIEPLCSHSSQSEKEDKEHSTEDYPIALSKLTSPLHSGPERNHNDIIPKRPTRKTSPYENNSTGFSKRDRTYLGRDSGKSYDSNFQRVSVKRSDSRELDHDVRETSYVSCDRHRDEATRSNSFCRGNSRDRSFHRRSPERMKQVESDRPEYSRSHSYYNQNNSYHSNYRHEHRSPDDSRYSNYPPNDSPIYRIDSSNQKLFSQDLGHSYNGAQNSNSRHFDERNNSNSRRPSQEHYASYPHTSSQQGPSYHTESGSDFRDNQDSRPSAWKHRSPPHSQRQPHRSHFRSPPRDPYFQHHGPTRGNHATQRSYNEDTRRVEFRAPARYSNNRSSNISEDRKRPRNYY